MEESSSPSLPGAAHCASIADKVVHRLHCLRPIGLRCEEAWAESIDRNSPCRPLDRCLARHIDDSALGRCIGYNRKFLQSAFSENRSDIDHPSISFFKHDLAEMLHTVEGAIQIQRKHLSPLLFRKFLQQFQWENQQRRNMAAYR